MNRLTFRAYLIDINRFQFFCCGFKVILYSCSLRVYYFFFCLFLLRCLVSSYFGSKCSILGPLKKGKHFVNDTCFTIQLSKLNFSCKCSITQCSLLLGILNKKQDNKIPFSLVRPLLMILKDDLFHKNLILKSTISAS